MNLLQTAVNFSFSWDTAALIALAKIIVIDIILSGDNAVVIAMATRSLQPAQRNQAIFWGTAGAVILRIGFAAVIVYLLKIPFVYFVGGLLLLWIAYKVLVEEEGEADVKAEDRLMKAIWTIVMADAVMSLDNVVAIAGAADGHLGMIALGVVISIPIMIFGSKLIVHYMEKYAWIAYVGSGILAWTAAHMLIGDKKVNEYIHIPHTGVTPYLIQAALTALVLGAGYMKNKKTAA